MTLPIRLRLTIVYSGAFLVVIALLALGTYASARAALNTVADQQLDVRLEGLEDHLSRHVGRVAWPELADSLQQHPAFEPAHLRIAGPDGAVLFESAAMRDLRVTYRPAVDRATLVADGHRLRILMTRRHIAGVTYDIALGADLLIATAILDRLWLVLLIATPAVLLATSGAGYWLSGRALAPLSAIADAARRIDSTRLSERLVISHTGDEVQQLACTFNSMLDRLEEGFRHTCQFSEDASHELRTPLAIVRAAAEVALLSDATNPQVYRDSLRRILHEAEDSSRLLEDLLFLARTDSGADPGRREPVELMGSVDATCTQITPLADARGVSIARLHAGDADVVEADPRQLRRLWLILLDNAVKYTAPGGRVVVSSGHTDDGRPFCAMADTGVGIASEHLPRLFERFYRVDKARLRGDGSGLGLAIAQTIARSHGATIEVVSRPGAGTTVRVTFARALRQRLDKAS